MIITSDQVSGEPGQAPRADYLSRWLIHYNYHRAHTATGNQPPATLAPTTATNVMMQNS